MVVILELALLCGRNCPSTGSVDEKQMAEISVAGRAYQERCHTTSLSAQEDAEYQDPIPSLDDFKILRFPDPPPDCKSE